jgi:hypothetical protein
MSRQKTWLRWGLIGLFFTGMAALALHWLLFHTGTHTGGDWTTDYYHFHWNYWWVRHALSTGLNVYETNYVLFPSVNNLAYHTLTLFWYPLWAVTEPLIGTLGAMNLILVVGMGLSGACTALLLRQQKVHTGLALIGGLIVLLSPTLLLAAMLSTVNYISLFWYPVQLLIWSQVARHTKAGKRGLLWALVQGVAFYAMMMTDFQFIIFMAFLLVPYGLLTLFQAGSWPARLRLAGLGGVALAIMLLLLWVAGPLSALIAYDTSGFSPMPIENAQSIPFPEGYLGRPNSFLYRQITLGGVILPLLALTVIASLTVLRRRVQDRGRWFWLALALPPLILTAGHEITLGETVILMPYTLLHQAFEGLFRSPGRFDTVFLLAALIFIGRTWSPVLSRRPRLTGWVTVAGVLVVVAESQLFASIPIQAVTPHYSFYDAMGAEPYDYAIVEVPVAGGSGEAWVGDFRPMEAQYYGITHGKQMLNGSIARTPLSHFWHWLVDDPMLAWLGQRRYLEPELVEAQLRERIPEWPIGYIVIHQDWIGRFGPTNQEIIGYFNSLPKLLCPAFVEGDAIAYRSAWHPDGCPTRIPPQDESGDYMIDMGPSGDERYLGWGWHGPEDVAGLKLRWTGEYPEATLYLDLPPDDYTVSLSAQAFHEARELRLLVNGEALGEAVTVQPDHLQTFTFDLPASVIGDGQHITLTLAYNDRIAPADIHQGEDVRRLALLVDWLRFTPEG